MKALNSKEITKKYLIFLLNFSVLLAFTVFCYFLFLKSGQQQSKMIQNKKEKYDFIMNKRQQLSVTVDKLNSYLSMINTNQVENEDALEREILKLKNEANKELEVLKADDGGDYYLLFEKIIKNIEMVIDYKHALREAQAEEKKQAENLANCREMDKQITKELTKEN